MKIDQNLHCKFPFGHYVQVHEEVLPRNIQLLRTSGAICLRPTGNRQGGYKLMSLRTGVLTIYYRWNSLPMPKEVIERVSAMGGAQGQPKLLTFHDRKKYCGL